MSSEEVPATTEEERTRVDEASSDATADPEVQADGTVEEPITKAKQDVENAKADLEYGTHRS